MIVWMLRTAGILDLWEAMKASHHLSKNSVYMEVGRGPVVWERAGRARWATPGTAAPAWRPLLRFGRDFESVHRDERVVNSLETRRLSLLSVWVLNIIEFAVSFRGSVLKIRSKCLSNSKKL
jgi:hypothetical protein